MQKLLIFAAALALATAAASAAPDGPNTVAEVRVRGNRQLTAQQVLLYVKTRPGQSFDEDLARADQRALLKTGKFDSVVVTKTATDQGVLVTFIVTERPLIAAVQFDGNKALSSSELSKGLGFGEGDPLNAFTVEAGRQAVENAYHSKGYYFAQVTVDSAALNDQGKVIYRIVEGPKVAIDKIRIEGNEYFSDWRLKMQISSQARLWFIIGGELDMDKVDHDVQALRNLYVEEGFLDAEVGRLLDFSEDKHKVTLTFVVHEGPRYRVNRVLFRGNSVFSNEELAKRLSLGEGAFYTAQGLRRDVEALQDTYGELGFLHAQVDSRRQYLDPAGPLPDWAQGIEPKPALLNVIFEIVEKDQYTIGAITIRGNSVTQDRVIRRNLRFYPEQLYNTVAVADSRRQLLETRLFDEVTIDPVGDDEHVRDVLVRVKEGRTAEFLIGLGVSSNDGLVGNISLTQRNFDIANWPGSWEDIRKNRAWKGAGQTFRIVAEPGTEFMRFRIEWTEPYLFDKPYSLDTAGFLWTRGREDYDETRYGGVFSLGHRFKNRWYGELSTRVEDVEITDLDSDAPPEARDVEGGNLILGFKAALVRDRTDSRWNPSTGDRIYLSYEQVTGDFSFGRATGEYRIYRTLYVDALDRKHILAARVSAANIFGDAPLFERFYAGGIGSIRGFEYRGISPRSAGTDKPIGGDWMMLANVEYSFPLVLDVIRGVVFIDSGTVTEDFEIDPYRASIGVGVRWVIPLLGPVPISLNVAYPIAKDGNDDTQIFSFSLGVTF